MECPITPVCKCLTEHKANTWHNELDLDWRWPFGFQVSCSYTASCHLQRKGCVSVCVGVWVILRANYRSHLLGVTLRALRVVVSLKSPFYSYLLSYVFNLYLMWTDICCANKMDVFVSLTVAIYEYVRLHIKLNIFCASVSCPQSHPWCHFRYSPARVCSISPKDLQFLNPRIFS